MKSRIVYVDDNPTLHLLVTRALRRLDVEVLCYVDGLSALEELPKIGNVDLFIFDIMMPTINGYDLCRRVKELPRYNSVDVIFISAKSGADNRVLGYKVGAVNYLEKPFELRELEALVLSLLPKQSKTAFKIEIDTDKRTIIKNGVSTKLTPSEFGIFSKLVKTNNHFVKRDTLIDSLNSKKNKKSSSRSLDTHISSLRKKLAPLGLQVNLVYSEGYSLSESSEKKDIAS